MKTYTVTIQTADQDHEIDKVVADGIIPEMPYRWFHLEDGERVEVPYGLGVTFWFSAERAEVVAENMKRKSADATSN